jgi:protein gp37
MNRTKIEWLNPPGIKGFTWNPYTGCLNWKNGVCKGGGQEFYCWARAMAQRFPERYHFGFEPTFYPGRYQEPLSRKKPAFIGISFMGDLFGDWMWSGNRALTVAPTIQREILHTVEACPQHTFLFLTKCSWNLSRWNPWPENAWVGVSATDEESLNRAFDGLFEVEAKVKYLSIEPLLEDLGYPILSNDINWVIVGAATGRKAPKPRLEWINDIVRACKEVNIPIFMKNNLRRIFPGLVLRQEWPQEDC